MYNFDMVTSELRTILNQHGVPDTDTILREYEQRLTQKWDAQGIDPNAVNNLFRKQQSQAAGQSRQQ